MSATRPLVALAAKLVQQDAQAAAHSIESMTEEDAREIIKALPPSSVSKRCPHLSPDFAAYAMQVVSGDSAIERVTEVL